MIQIVLVIITNDIVSVNAGVNINVIVIYIVGVIDCLIYFLF